MIFTQIEVGSLATNCYVIKINNSCILIDPGKINNELRKQILPYRKLHIFLTHAHYDHIGGLHELMKEFECEIFINKKDKPLLEDSHKNLSFYIENPVEYPEIQTYGKDKDFTVNVEDYEFKFLHTPGHTPGSSCILVKEEEDLILFSGDTLFKGSVGRTDLPHSNEYTLISSIKHKLLNLPSTTRVYPGHGPPTTIEEEKKNNFFIQNIWED